MKQIPHNDEMEKGLLGGLLLNQNEYPEIAEMFHEELFYSEANRIVARAIKTIKIGNNPVDIVAVMQWVRKNSYDKVCPAGYISELTNIGIVHGFMQKTFALNEYYIRRKIIYSGTEVINRAYEDLSDPFELIGEQEKNINEITQKISIAKTADTMDCHMDLVEHLNKLDKLNEGELIGVDTGFYDLNKVTAGWQKTDLIILAARPGMGKTSFILNCIQAAAKKEPTLIFSLEMSKMQLYARMCSQVTQIPLNKFLKEKMNPHERTAFNQLTSKLMDVPMFFEDKGGIDINFIKTKSRRLKREKNIGLIVIDYLQLISRVKSNKSTNDDVGVITGELKSLAKELQIPIIALSQLVREVEKTPDKVPKLSHLRDGGSIEQDADIVMFIYRPEYYDILDDGSGNSTVGMAQIIIAKNRNGSLDVVTLGFNGKCTNFFDTRSPQVTSLVPNEEFY